MNGHEENTVHIITKGPGKFDFHTFPLGTTEIIEEEGLTPQQVCDRLDAAPQGIDILCFDDTGKAREQINVDPAIFEELARRGRALHPQQTCRVCKGTRVVASQACPECAVPWRP